MSLRDWFAGQALPSVIIACFENAMAMNETMKKKGIEDPSVLFASLAYAHADAMLKERNREN